MFAVSQNVMPRIALAYDVPMAQVAMAWVLNNPVVSAPTGRDQAAPLLPTPSPRSTPAHRRRDRLPEAPYAPRLPTFFNPLSWSRARPLDVSGGFTRRISASFDADDPQDLG